MQKGQIFSLDFLIATAIAILAIGLVFQYSELQVYDLKDSQIFGETKRIAGTAGSLLAGNPAITCDLKNSSGVKITELPNCVDSSTTIAKELLGIPSSYNCSIVPASGTLNSTECPSTGNPSAQDFYTVQRTIVMHNGALFKSDYDNCINGRSGCTLSASTAVLIKIWK